MVHLLDNIVCLCFSLFYRDQAEEAILEHRLEGKRIAQILFIQLRNGLERQLDREGKMLP